MQVTILESMLYIALLVFSLNQIIKLVDNFLLMKQQHELKIAQGDFISKMDNWIEGCNRDLKDNEDTINQFFKDQREDLQSFKNEVWEFLEPKQSPEREEEGAISKEPIATEEVQEEVMKDTATPAKKTVKEWLESIEDTDIRNKALVNMKIPDIQTESLADALVVAFVWELSEDGYDYWRNVQKKYLQN